jgi:hypothetical protein
MVKLKITQYNLKGMDDCGWDKSSYFIAGLQADITIDATTMVSDRSDPILQSRKLNTILFS